jgi:V8-like Glu-specific endopeptidase
MSTEYKEKLSAEEIRAYWTPERMAAARARDWTPATAPKPDTEPVPPTGEQKDIAGYDPTQSAEGSGIGGPSPVPSPTTYPWCTVGKLYFVANEKNFVGSACVIHKNVLLTAAHNIYTVTDGWSQNFIFVPALTGAQKPFGDWVGIAAGPMDEWQKFGTDPSYDVGVVMLKDGGKDNKPIGDVVGWLGQTYNCPITPSLSWVETAYTETTMLADTGTYTRSMNNGRVVCKTGELGAGSSGGPWLCGEESKYVNGIVSYAQSATESGSPYFRTEIQNFINKYT